MYIYVAYEVKAPCQGIITWVRVSGASSQNDRTCDFYFPTRLQFSSFDLLFSFSINRGYRQKNGGFEKVVGQKHFQPMGSEENVRAGGSRSQCRPWSGHFGQSAQHLRLDAAGHWQYVGCRHLRSGRIRGSRHGWTCCLSLLHGGRHRIRLRRSDIFLLFSLV